MDKRAGDHFDSKHSPDWSGIIDPLVDAGQMNAYIIPHITYFNVGTPEEYQEAENFLHQQSRQSK